MPHATSSSPARSIVSLAMCYSRTGRRCGSRPTTTATPASSITRAMCLSMGNAKELRSRSAALFEDGVLQRPRDPRVSSKAMRTFRRQQFESNTSVVDDL